jgi:hypothetical protein
MDLTDDDVRHLPEADLREVDPPVQVEMATRSPGGRLDWWVKERHSGSAESGSETVVNGGSELLIFVRRATHSHDRQTFQDGGFGPVPASIPIRRMPNPAETR